MNNLLVSFAFTVDNLLVIVDNLKQEPGLVGKQGFMTATCA